MKGRTADGYYNGVENEEMYVLRDEIIGLVSHKLGEVVTVFVDQAYQGKGSLRKILEFRENIISKNEFESLEVLLSK